jgi:tetratricopeptide (TPR) repeat protein
MTQARSPPSKAATLQEICDRGRALHEQGRLEEARSLYKKVLVRDPKHFGALYLLGLLCARTGQGELGVSLIRRAMAVSPGIAGTHGELGDVLRDMERHEEAVASYGRAIALAPDYFEAHHNRGLSLQTLGRSQEALASYDAAIGLRTDLAQPYYNRGIALQALGRAQEALASYDVAIARRSDDANAHNNRGTVLSLLRRHQDAVASFDRAIALQPGHAEALDNRGIALAELGRLEEALASHDRAIALNPRSALAHFHRGAALGALKRHDDALAACDEAIGLKPDYAEAWANRAAALGGLKRHAEALASAETAIALMPDHVNAHYVAGVALGDLERLEDALASYDRAIDLQPGHADARLNRGMLRLLLGQFETGWRDYEWRKHKLDAVTDNLSDESLWSGRQDPSGKRIFVHYEQGLGDTIQFSRYLKLLEDRHADVVLMAQPPLHAIMRQMFPTFELLGPGDAPGDIDLHCPLLSLPLAFGTTLASIPPPAPPIRAEEARRAVFRARLGSKAKPRVGIAWSGNPDHKNDHERSIAFERLLPLLTDEVEWTALQNDIRPGDLAAFQRCGRVGFHGDQLVDFADTAALIDLMDLVIAVDTSVAHLAGAMSKPVWILLPFMPDWRWMLGRSDSPWYPSARLFRQPCLSDWEGAIDAVRAELERVPKSGNRFSDKTRVKTKN